MSHIQELIDSDSEIEELLPSSFEEKLPYYEVTPREEALIRKRENPQTYDTFKDFTISNVSQYFELNDEMLSTTIDGPGFSSKLGIKGDTWSWKIVFKRPGVNSWVYVFANSAKNDLGIRAIISMYIIDDQKKLIFLGHRPDRWFGECDLMVTQLFPQGKEIDRKKLLPNDSLNLRLKLTVLLDDKTPLPAYIPIKPVKVNLPSHFKDLYLSRNKTGNVIVKVQDRVFQIHQQVLEKRCPWLLTIFAMQVVHNKSFEVSDVDCNTFEKILQFLYLDEVIDVEDYIVPLWKASSNYRIPALMRRCEIIISEDFLSVENANVVYNLARKIKSGHLAFYVEMFYDINKK